MTGSLQIKKDYYYAVLNFYDENGKRVPKWIATGYKVKNNKKKAESKLSELCEEYRGREHVNNVGGMLFDEYIIMWHKKKKPYIELSTWEGYACHLKHITNYFKDKKIKVSELQSSNFVEYYDYQLQYGRTAKRKSDDTGLSTRTVKSHSLLIKAALNDAILLNAIKTNPALNVTVPNKPHVKKSDDDDFLDIEEIKYFLNKIKSHRLKNAFTTILFYGLRRSEGLGLTWSAIDAETKEISINRTVVRVSTLVEKDRTKNESSTRTYPIFDMVQDILDEIKESQNRNRKLFGEEYYESDYIFTWEDGRPYSPDYLTKTFKKFVKRDECLSSKLTLHSLRKSCVSMLVEQGYSIKDIQKWVGHTEDSEVTLKVYAKVKDRKKNNIADAINSQFTALVI